MGCSSSAHAKVRPTTAQAADSSCKRVKSISSIPHTIEMAFDKITKGVDRVVIPPGCVPVLCLSTESVPIITAPLLLQEGEQTKIRLPAIAISIAQNARIAAISQVKYLAQQYFQNDYFSRLFENILHWVSHQEPSRFTSSIGLLGIPSSVCKFVQSILTSYGIQPVILSGINFILKGIPAILFFSDYEFSSTTLQSIIDYLKAGGGAVCIYSPPSEDIENETPRANPLLQEFGLAFAFCSLNPDSDKARYEQIPSSIEMLKKNRFSEVIDEFIEELNQDTPFETIDDTAMCFRYYVMAASSREEKLIAKCFARCWDYLTRNNYYCDGFFCPTTAQKIVAVIIEDLFPKITENWQRSPAADIFPGKCEEKQEDVTISIQLRPQTLIFTGFWLPTDVTCLASCIGEFDDVHVQVGSHSAELIKVCNGEWKRWPNIVTVFNIQNAENPDGTVCAMPHGNIVQGMGMMKGEPSQVFTGEIKETDDGKSDAKIRLMTLFGGLIYFGSSEYLGMVDIALTNVCRAPYFDDDFVFHDSKVPWGEMASELLILTLPTENMREIKKPQLLMKTLDKMIEKTTEFMGYKITRPYRVVFDIALDQNDFQYPISFPLSEIGDILCAAEEFTPALFRLMTAIAVVSLREDFFDQETEFALATVIAALVFETIIDDFDPFTYEAKGKNIALPLLFKELWTIQKQVDSNLLRQVIMHAEAADFLSSDEEVQEDRWVVFILNLCKIGKLNFMDLFQSTRIIPLNIHKAIQKFPKPTYASVVPRFEIPLGQA